MAIAVLRRAVELGVDHIDTSQYYGPDVANELIRDALHPYPDGLRIVTKVGARRGPDAEWLPALRPDELRAAVEDNLRTLRLERMDLVNLRLLAGEVESQADAPTLAESLGALVDLRDEGKVELIGLSAVTVADLDEASALTEIAGVQNSYNLLDRTSEPLLGPRASAAWPSRRSSRSAPPSEMAASGSPSTPPWSAWPRSTARRRPRSRWPGCCSAPRTCS